MSIPSVTKVAIIGAGIGREHLEAYLLMPERFRVSALCDLDTARATEVVGSRDIPVVSELEEVLTDDSITLVDVCLPPHLHASISIRAMEAGKQVICEKPLVNSLAEADGLLEVAHRTGKRLTPVFQYRFGPAMAQLRALQEAGLCGMPYVASLETHWDRRAEYYDVPWRGTWAGENGGAVLGHAIHNHDLLTSIMGPVESVSAFVATRVNPIEVEDCASVTFRMANGALATSSITLGAADDTTRLRVCFEKLTATSGTSPYAPLDDPWTFTARDPADQARVNEVLSGTAPVRSSFAGFLEALADAFDGDEHSVVTADDGRRSIELVAAIYESARSGRAVSLPLERDSLHYDGWVPTPLTQ